MGYLKLYRAYFTIEGENSEYLGKMLRNCGNAVEYISAKDKVKYHAAAVYASNLVTGLYDISVEILQKCGLSKKFSYGAFRSLLLENVGNIASEGVINSLTGPIERADFETVEKHLNSLDGDKKEIYRLVSCRLIDIAKQKNPGIDYSDLCMLLEKQIGD